MSHCGRGDEYIVGQMAHTYRWEGGGAAVLGSVQPQPLEHEADGRLALERIEAAIKPNDAHFAKSRLLCLENTIGGKVLPLDYLEAATALARSRGLATHLDGARLFNAAVKLGVPGRGARGAVRQRLGLLLEGPRRAGRLGARRLEGASSPRAHRWRKMLGGGMRQAGVLAAAALYALDHHVERLAEDHALAAASPRACEGLPGLTVEPPQTNIVFADLAGERAAGLMEHLKSRGVLATGLYRLRFVTHLDVDAEGVDRAVAAMREHLAH